ncbi:anthranilate phosphoribosyltransferase [Bacillaceae bacterium S4-13-56]
MSEFLTKVVEGQHLSEEEAFEAMNRIMQGEVPTGHLMSFLSVLRFRGETVEELTGFARAMRSNMRKVDLGESVIDTCGTGGDGSSTFNISTAVSVVLASMGAKVAKHGNRKVSSASGSADVLEALGLPVFAAENKEKEMMEDIGLTFLFAPNYHQAMKHAVTARKELGFRTVFNLLGPLSNPAQAKRQLIGLYDTSIAEKIAETLKSLGSEHVLLVTGRDGLDEISITGSTDIVELKSGEIHRFVLSPEEVGLPVGQLKDIQIHHPDESAELIKDIFYGRANESSTNIVVLNAAAGLYIAGLVEDIKVGVIRVQQALKRGDVARYFEGISDLKEKNQYA